MKMKDDKNLYKYLTKYIKPSSKVLDIGCGNASIRHMINGTYYGVDIESSYDKCIKCDIEKNKLPFKNKVFDVVIMTEVLEHLTDYKKCFKEIKRVLKRDGIFIGSVPNCYSPIWIISYFFGIHKSKWADNDMHLVTFDKWTLNNLLEANEFKDIFIRTSIGVSEFGDYLIFKCGI